MNFCNSIGGYFELELRSGKEYHSRAIKLNTGRNAFEYILRVKNYRKVYLPYYTCNVMLEPIKKLNIEVSYYHIDKNFEPVFNWDLISDKEVFVYTNYFGICDKIVLVISKKCKNLIIDNSQSFFSKAMKGVPTFYSPRKFFGVPDGGYLYSEEKLVYEFEQDYSIHRMEHLLGRIDKSAEEYFEKFKMNEDSLINQPIRLMSKLTLFLLKNIDYRKVSMIRKENFDFIHSKIYNLNELVIRREPSSVPMVYPFLIKNGYNLR